MLTRVRRALVGAERLGNAMAIDPAQTSVLAAVSNAMVRLHKDQFGRGPTRARTEWAGPDQLVVTLEDTLTPVERRLRAMGEHERLRDTRPLFPEAAQAQPTGGVRGLSGPDRPAL